MALKWRKPAPLELAIWDMAEKFGWTLAYIESLTMEQFDEYQQVRDGRMKATRGEHG